MTQCSIPVATMMVAGAVVMAGVFGWRRHAFRHHAHCHAHCGSGQHEAHGFGGRWVCTCGDSCTCEDPCDSGPGRHASHHAGGKWGSQFVRRFWLRALLFKLDATPAQEKEMDAAFDEFDKHLGEAKALFESSRQAAARAIDGEVFDENAMGEAQAKANEASTQLKNALEAMLRRIHSVLDNEQRKHLAKLLARGLHSWWHGGGCHHHEG